MSVVEARLEKMKVVLPPAGPPAANYVSAVRTGSLVFLAGQGPLKDGRLTTGKLGRELTVEEGYAAARLTVINLLSALRAEIGDLDRVRRIVKVFGMINCTPEFEEHPKVLNGASDLLVEAFGERGKHARVAVGLAALPFGMAVEIDMIAEVG
jgi:enamine deaminase RidA (YjgF/YER057c/UK114 family)